MSNHPLAGRSSPPIRVEPETFESRLSKRYGGLITWDTSTFPPMESRNCSLSPEQERAEIEKRLAEMLAYFETQGITPVFVDFKDDEK